MKNFKRYIPIILLILHCCLIFFFSAQDAKSSASLSKGIVRTVIEATPGVKKLEKSQIDKVEHITRKIAHFVLFLMLGIYAYLSAESLGTRNKLMVALLFCLAYAASDELHQLFSNGRAGRISDVVLDFCGSLTGVTVTFLLRKKLEKRGKL